MHSIKFKFLASQANSIYAYKNIREKVQRCCANIYFNQRRLQLGVIPKYARICTVALTFILKVVYLLALRDAFYKVSIWSNFTARIGDCDKALAPESSMALKQSAHKFLCTKVNQKSAFNRRTHLLYSGTVVTLTTHLFTSDTIPT